MRIHFLATFKCYHYWHKSWFNSHQPLRHQTISSFFCVFPLKTSLEDSKLILPKAPWPVKSASYTVRLLLSLQLLGFVSSTVVNDCFNEGVFHLLQGKIFLSLKVKHADFCFFLKCKQWIIQNFGFFFLVPREVVWWIEA